MTSMSCDVGESWILRYFRGNRDNRGIFLCIMGACYTFGLIAQLCSSILRCGL